MDIKEGVLLDILNLMKSIEVMIKSKCDVELSLGRSCGYYTIIISATSLIRNHKNNQYTHYCYEKQFNEKELNSLKDGYLISDFCNNFNQEYDQAYERMLNQS